MKGNKLQTVLLLAGSAAALFALRTAWSCDAGNATGVLAHPIAANGVGAGVTIPAGTLYCLTDPPGDNPLGTHLVTVQGFDSRVRVAASNTDLAPGNPSHAANGGCTESLNFALNDQPAPFPAGPAVPPVQPPPATLPGQQGATASNGVGGRGPASAGGQPPAALPASAGGGTPPGTQAGPINVIQGPGTSYSGNAPGAQPAASVPTTLSEAANIADIARGTQIVDAATASREALQRAASSDHRALADAYRQVPTEALGSYLTRARDSLGEAADVLESGTGNLDPGEKARFRNYYLNARDKASLGIDAIAEDQQRKETLGATSPFANLLGPDDNPLARSAALADIFGAKLPSTAAATTPDALVNRLVMLNGLPLDQQAAMLGNLKLVERPTLTTPNGIRVSVPILHNGYIFGGGGSSMDCSSFVSASLPTDVRKGRFTTLDFYAMWSFRKMGRLPLPPSYPGDRGKLIEKTAGAFTALDLQNGDRLTVGDLLVYRVPSFPAGHVFIVKDYNPVTMVAEVIEAAQSAGTIRERDFPLSLDPVSEPQRVVRAGVFGLRLRPVSNKGCRYKEHEAPTEFHRPSTDPNGTTGGASL